MFLAEIRKISEFFLSENFQFLEVKCSIYLNRRVFVLTFWISENANFLHVDYEDTDQTADAQTDLSLCWAHMAEGSCHYEKKKLLIQIY